MFKIGCNPAMLSWFIKVFGIFWSSTKLIGYLLRSQISLDLARFKPMTLRSSLWEANVLPSELPSELPCFGEPIIDVPQLLKPVGNGSCFFVQCTFESQAVFGFMKGWHPCPFTYLSLFIWYHSLSLLRDGIKNRLYIFHSSWNLLGNGSCFLFNVLSKVRRFLATWKTGNVIKSNQKERKISPLKIGLVSRVIYGGSLFS